MSLLQSDICHFEDIHFMGVKITIRYCGDSQIKILAPSWLIYSPFCGVELRQFGINDLNTAIFENKHVYVIFNRDKKLMKMLEIFEREHYGLKFGYQVVNKLENGEVLQFFRE
jgi:hypothetical protein